MLLNSFILENIDAFFRSFPNEANNAQNVGGQSNEHSTTHASNLDKVFYFFFFYFTFILFKEENVSFFNYIIFFQIKMFHSY